ncbi:hypothetical protein ACJDU8_07035 [Clostridium sp. WILCCON 0269]|uniref:PIN domain-containing protein n=1 Tax=Candidatus Clostridium eludens TaxID=3381663 RepID=A0ABW8SH03_9CLOT
MNFILDTNAFYSLYGRNRLGIDTNSVINETRLRNVLLNYNHDIHISNVTLYEIITFFSSGNLNRLAGLLDYIRKKNIGIVNLGISDITRKDLDTLVTAKESLLKILVKDYISKKVDVESQFATDILLLQLRLYVIFYFEREESLNESFRNLPKDKKNDIKFKAFDVLLQDRIAEYLKILSSKFKKILRQAYFKGKDSKKDEYAEKCVKDEFNNILYQQSRVFSLFLELLMANHENMEPSDNVVCKKLIEIYRNSGDYGIIEENPGNVNDGIGKLIKQFEDLNYTEFIKEHKQDAIDIWGENSCFTRHQIEYIGILFEKWMKESAKYKKNDMLDMFILRALDMKNWVILTFDNRMQNYIFLNSPESEKYIKKFDLRYRC